MRPMSERITRDDVAAVARLARLRLSDDELDLSAKELDAILGHVADMESLDVDGVEPTFHPFPLRNVLRDDVAAPSLDRDEVMASAPAPEDGMFRVPPVIGEAP